MHNFILNSTESHSDLEIKDFITKISNRDTILFLTSGTTADPKEITHSYEKLVKNIKTNPNYKDHIWALTYHHSKLAGTQVILQAYMNGGKIVNLFGKSNEEILHSLNYYEVTHISATPTFYRLLPNAVSFNKVAQVTLGGEPVDSQLLHKIKKIFPKSKITNIYALTEFGTLITSENEYFELSEKNKNFIKIIDCTIYVKENNEWQNTGDVVEWLDESKFKIVGREYNMINVGGNKVNPIKIETAINSLSYVVSSYVYSQKNSVTGSIVSADIILKDHADKIDVRRDLKETLENFEIPMKINFVEKIKINSTGKIIRR